MITSHNNPLVKRIKRLRMKKHRQREEAFFVEGLRVVASAVEAGAPIEAIVWCDELLTSDFGRNVLLTSSIRKHELSTSVFQGISERDNPTGIGAVISIQHKGVRELEVAPDSLYVGLVGISDPGNLGTILRTIDATGASGAILVGDTTDPYHPICVKASMGTIFSTAVVGVKSAEQLLAWANFHRLHTITTSAKALIDYTTITYPRPLLLLMGSEGAGLSSTLLQAADQSVSIPMNGHASSLNLAVATGLLLYEANRNLQSIARLKSQQLRPIGLSEGDFIVPSDFDAPLTLT